MSVNLFESNSIYNQDIFINKASEIISMRARGDVPLAYVRTYGCQQNVSDGEKIKGMLSSMGYEFTNSVEEADFVIFNTCAIREHAEDRVFGNVGALKAVKRRHPSMIIALCGCMMEQEHVAEKIRKSYPFVNLVFGTHSLHHFPELLYNTLSGEKRIFERGIDDNRIVEGIPTRRDGNFKAWLPIMYGCDNFCSYCIVPYVRGRERSRLPSNILDEANSLIKSGYKDITLLGQNVNSYGKNLNENINFSELLKKIDSIDGEFWLRFMTSHPKDATKELIDTIAESEHICNHLHLPFQSGNNRILKEMNRKYTRERYLDIVNYAKQKIPNLSLTSDIIVGFPGETYEEFCDTLSLVKEVGFTSLFTFIFSAREGTPAAKMDDPIPYKEKSEWFTELLNVQEGIAAKRCSSMVGNVYKVLVEGENSKGELTSRTQENIIVELKGEKALIGNFINVKITEARNWILKGTIV